MNRCIPFFMVFMLIQNFCISQSTNIQWGALSRGSGALQAIMPVEDADFFGLRYSGNSILGSYYLVEYENMMRTQSSKIKMVAEQGIANLEKVLTINKEPVVFLSDKINGNLCIYLRKLDASLRASGEIKEIACYRSNKLMSRPEFKVISSVNNSFVAVIWEIPGKKVNADIYGFKVLDSSFNEVNSGEYQIPFNGNMATINQYHLSNTGDFFLNLTEHLKPNDRFFSRNFRNFKAMHVYQINQDGLEEFSLNLNGRRISDMQMKSNDNKVFTFSGLYAENSLKRGISGVFYLRINYQTKELINQGFIPFESEKINKNWSIVDNRYIKRYRNGNEPELYNYRLRNMEVLKDGSIIGSMEQYYVYSRTNYDTRSGSSNTINYYYYDDIVAFKIGSQNKFDWITTIPKSQSSVNDGGPFSSYANYVDSSHLCLIFNDNIKNYDDQGEFKSSDKIRSFSLSPRRNAVALVKINLKTGERYRSTLFRQKEIRSIAVPKLFYVNRDKKEMILYAISRGKERFGIIQYGR